MAGTPVPSPLWNNPERTDSGFAPDQPDDGSRSFVISAFCQISLHRFQQLDSG